MENDQKLHFRVRVGDVEIEASGPEEYIKEIRAYAEQIVLSSLSRMKTFGAISPKKDSSSFSGTENALSSNIRFGQPLEKDESIAEFLERVPNKTHQDKIIAFAYYLEKNREIKTFGIKEINDCYDEIKEAKSNTAVYLNLLVKSGLIMKAKGQTPGGPAQYVLTRKGEKTINNAMASRESA